MSAKGYTIPDRVTQRVESLGRFLRRTREARSWRLADVAEPLECHPSNIAAYEMRVPGSVRAFFAIVDALGLDLTDLAREVGDLPPDQEPEAPASVTVEHANGEIVIRVKGAP